MLSGGTSPSSAHRNYRCGLDQAARYGRGISELGENLDGESAHRPPQKHKGKSSKPKTSECLLLQLRSHKLPQQQTTITSSVATLDWPATSFQTTTAHASARSCFLSIPLVSHTVLLKCPSIDISIICDNMVVFKLL